MGSIILTGVTSLLARRIRRDSRRNIITEYNLEANLYKSYTPKTWATLNYDFDRTLDNQRVCKLLISMSYESRGPPVRVAIRSIYQAYRLELLSWGHKADVNRCESELKIVDHLLETRTLPFVYCPITIATHTYA